MIRIVCSGHWIQISVISEPQLVAEARELLPGDIQLVATVPNFLFVVLDAC